MALVAYSDDSDLGSDSDDGEKCVEGPATTVCKPEVEVVNSVPRTAVGDQDSIQSTVAGGGGPDTLGVHGIIDEDEERFGTKLPGLLASIPAAKPLRSVWQGLSIGEEVDELTDVPTVDTWKITQELKGKSIETDKFGSKPNNSAKDSVSKSKKERRKVQFFVPALSEFAEDDEEDDEHQEPEHKKIKPSSSGTGLFSLLPQPKHITVKEAKRSLVPHILTKKSVPVKNSPKSKFKPKNTTVLSENDSDDESNTAASDFFSLSETADIDIKNPPAEILSVPDVDPNIRNMPVLQTFKTPQILPQETTVYSSISQYSSTQSQETEAHYPSQHIETYPDSNAGIDEEAMVRLAGKRRGKGEAINFIDVNADDALLTRDEWMTKALTEEKPTHSFSKKRDGMPSQKQKQKHQITYLAHQAKERELELKNNWAQNRMTKMQTQAKYGF
nr:proline-rich protein PRCC-like [Procambarus clarkii]